MSLKTHTFMASGGVIGVVLLGCTTSLVLPTEPPPSPDASAPQCGFSLPITADPIQPTQVGGVPPPLAHPSLPPFEGIYVLEALTTYTGDGGASGSNDVASMALRVQAGPDATLTIELEASDESETLETISLVHVLGFSVLEFAESCPSPGDVSELEYSFNGSTLVMRGPDGYGTIDEQFVLVQN